MAQSTQVSGGGWVANKLVGGWEGHPNPDKSS